MTGLIFHLIAHTHWDREWYLPQAAFQARLVGVLDELIERLRADAGYRSFLLDGQTVLLADYLRARPERESDLKALVKTGRLQVGPWYVLADELIPSGEALVRNLLFGAADAEHWGARLDVLYSPDAFGHPGILPTLAREFGLRAGVVWRGLGGERGQERDLYRWCGPDGKEILLWHLPPQGYEIGAALPADANRLPGAWAAVREALVQRAASAHIPLFVGADHRAAHPDLPRLRDLLAELDTASAFRVSRLDEFFQAAAETVKPGPPVLAGELRWSYRYAWTLQGVHGTRAPLKRRNAELELWLERFAEPLAALARRRGGRDRRALLDLAWRTLVQCHFHDALAGCSSDAVSHAVEARFLEVEAVARQVVQGSLWDLVGHDPDHARERAAEQRPTLVLWNPAARPRGGVVVADVTLFRRDVIVGAPAGRKPRQGEGYRPFALRAPDGRSVPVQVLDRRPDLERLDAARHYPDQDEVDRVRIAFRAPSVSGLGLATLGLAPPERLSSHEGVEVRGRSLVNRFVEATLEPSGALALRDRRTGERFFDLLRLEDGGDAGDTYTYCPPARDRVVRATGPIKVRRLAAGPLVAALEARQALRGARGGRVGVRFVVMLHADSPRFAASSRSTIRRRTIACGRGSQPPSRGGRRWPVPPSGPSPAPPSSRAPPTIRWKRPSAPRRHSASSPRPRAGAAWLCSRPASSSTSGRRRATSSSPCSGPWGSCRAATCRPGPVTPPGRRARRSPSARGRVASSSPSRPCRRRTWNRATRWRRCGRTCSSRSAASGCGTRSRPLRRRSRSRSRARGSWSRR